jgi:hemoglobin
MAGWAGTGIMGEKARRVMSIFERLGQEQGIRAAVDDFYERVVGDPQLAHYFDGVDLRVLRGHQTALLVQVTGGPAAYSGRDLAIAHARLGITPEDFDRVVGHLVATLSSFGVSAEDIGAVGEALTAYRDEIVTAPAPA